MRLWGLVALLALVALGTSGCGSKGAVPAADTRLVTDEPALTTSEAPNVEIAHPGVIVRMNADAPGRKPYLRVDVVIQYAPGATGDAATKSAQLATATRLARLASA